MEWPLTLAASSVFMCCFRCNLLGYSIGGPTSNNQPPLNNLLGLLVLPKVCLALTISMRLTPHQFGVISTFSKSSNSKLLNTHLQLYSGNDYEVQVPQFQQYYDALIEGVDADTQYANLIDFHITRFNDSVTRNPYFSTPPSLALSSRPPGSPFLCA